jgi:hypothetical protein
VIEAVCIGLGTLVGLGLGFLLRIGRAEVGSPRVHEPSTDPVALERGHDDLLRHLKNLDVQQRSLGIKLEHHFVHLLTELQQLAGRAPGTAGPAVTMRAAAGPVAGGAGRGADRAVACADPRTGLSSRSTPASPRADAVQTTVEPPGIQAAPAGEVADPLAIWAAAVPPQGASISAHLVELWNRRDWRPAGRLEARRALAAELQPSGWKLSEPLAELYLLVYRGPLAPMFLLPFLGIDVTLFEPALFDGPEVGAANRLVEPAEVRFREQTTTIEQELAKLVHGTCTIADAVVVDARGVIA